MYNTAKPQQPVEEIYGLARTAGFGVSSSWNFCTSSARNSARGCVKEGPGSHEFLELLFPFFRRELLLEVTHIRSDDTTKWTKTAQRDDVLRLRLLVLDGGKQKW